MIVKVKYKGIDPENYFLNTRLTDIIILKNKQHQQC